MKPVDQPRGYQGGYQMPKYNYGRPWQGQWGGQYQNKQGWKR